MNFWKTQALFMILFNQSGSIGFGRRYPLMAPDDDGGNGGGGDTPPKDDPKPDAAAEELKNLKAQLLESTKQNAQLQSQISGKGGDDLNDKIKNETDPAKVVKLLKEQISSTADENKNLKKSIMAANIQSTFQRIAGDKVHDVTDLLNHPEFQDILKSSLNQQTLTIDETIASAYIDRLLDKKPYLKKVAPVPGAITSKPASNTKGKAVSEMSSAEIEAELKRIWK